MTSFDPFFSGRQYRDSVLYTRTKFAQKNKDFPKTKCQADEIKVHSLFETNGVRQVGYGLYRALISRL